MILPFRTLAKGILTLMLLILSTLPASADRFQYGDLYFNTTSENTCEVTFLDENYWENNYDLTEVSIPELAVYKGKSYTVTTIGYNAFYHCRSLTSIDIPSSVTTIGNDAFYWCSSLTSITIPNSVTTIGNYAFEDCSTLTSINIPNSVTAIGNDAFRDCTSLTSINIPNSVTTIGDGAFDSCSSLTSIDIPNSVTTIESHAFRNCTSLTSIDLPNSVTTIGDGTFYGCSSLTSIVIPSSVTTIGDYAFSWCSSLTSIDIPNSVTTIGNGAFYWCSSLTSIAIPNSVTTIGELAFQGCKSLTSIAIPSSVTTIGDRAFYGCENLTSIDVDASNTAYASIEGILFTQDITTIVVYPAGKTDGSYNIPSSVTTIGDGAFYGCESLTSIDIPSSVTTIGNSAFSDCSSLTGIDIPSSVTTIGDLAFFYCSSLTDIYNYASVPQAIGFSDFEGVPTTATLHVIKGYKDVYEAAVGWSQFNIVDDLDRAITPFTFEQEEYHCAVGESFTPSVVGIAADLLEWTSSDSSILYIDPVYYLCLGRKDGVAYITAAQKDHPENSATVRVIVGDSATAIESLTTDDPATEIYTLDGRRTDYPANGIGIVRTADGKTRKVMTK